MLDSSQYWKYVAVVSGITFLSLVAAGIYTMAKQSNTNKASDSTKTSKNEELYKQESPKKHHQPNEQQTNTTEPKKKVGNDWKKKYAVKDVDFDKLFSKKRISKHSAKTATKPATKKKNKSPMQMRHEEDKKMELIVSGYCHQHGIVSSIVFDVVFRYFYLALNELKSLIIFNKANKSNFIGDSIEIVDNHNVILVGDGMVMIDYIVSNEIGNIFEWEIKFNKIGSSSYIGFVDADIFSRCPVNIPYPPGMMGFMDFVEDDESKKYQFCLSVDLKKSWFCRYSKYHHGDKEIECHINSWKLGRGEISPPEFRNGDVFRFRVDFRRKICDLFVNDELFWEKIFIKIPNRIIPGVSNSGGTTECSLRLRC